MVAITAVVKAVMATGDKGLSLADKHIRSTPDEGGFASHSRHGGRRARLCSEAVVHIW